jgi:hypothetical protein
MSDTREEARMLTPIQRHQYIEQLRTFPARLEATVSMLSAENLTTAYLPGEWTVAQNVHHLVDSHMNAVIRMKLTLTEERPTLRTYDQDVWAELPDSIGADLSLALHILHGLHLRWALLLDDLPEAAWQRVCLHPEQGEQTLADLLTYYAQHGDNHIDQIQRTLAAAS